MQIYLIYKIDIHHKIENQKNWGCAHYSHIKTIKLT